MGAMLTHTPVRSYPARFLPTLVVTFLQSTVQTHTALSLGSVSRHVVKGAFFYSVEYDTTPKVRIVLSW